VTDAQLMLKITLALFGNKKLGNVANDRKKSYNYNGIGILGIAIYIYANEENTIYKDLILIDIFFWMR